MAQHKRSFCAAFFKKRLLPFLPKNQGFRGAEALFQGAVSVLQPAAVMTSSTVPSPP
jgi:hypothetical protein